MGVGALVGLEAEYDGGRSPLENNKREEQKTQYSSHVGSEVITVTIAVGDGIVFKVRLRAAIRLGKQDAVQ